MSNELGMRKEELGIPIRPPCNNFTFFSRGWAAFLIPPSYFLIDGLRSGCNP